MTVTVIAKKFHVLKILIVFNLNVNYVFAQELIMTINAAHEHREIIKLLIREYDVNLNDKRSYFIHVVI